jgi:hypothetical protein
MTKTELLEALKDVPADAEVFVDDDVEVADVAEVMVFDPAFGNPAFAVITTNAGLAPTA